MSDCSVCSEPLFHHTPNVEPPALEPVCALACGHTYHTSCIKGWFAADRFKRTLPTCPSCRNPSRQIVPLKFDGDPTLGGGDDLLKKKMRRLNERAKRTAGREPDGLELARVVGELEDLVEEELKVKTKDEWATLGDDPELRNNLASLTASLLALRSYIPKVMDFTTLRADLLSARTLLSNQADQIAAHSIALANQLATLKEKAHRKLESQKQKYDAEAEKKEKARRAEEDRLKLERKMMEEKAKTAAEEKRQAINRAEEFRAKERERLETCDRQLGQLNKLKAKLKSLGSDVGRLETENLDLTLQLARASSSSQRRNNKRPSSEMIPSSDVDELDYGFGVDLDGADESLEVGDLSYHSHYSPIQTRKTYRSSTTSTSRPSSVSTSASSRQVTAPLASSSKLNPNSSTSGPAASTLLSSSSSHNAFASASHLLSSSSKRLKPTTSSSAFTQTSLRPNMPSPLLAMGPKVKRKAIG